MSARVVASIGRDREKHALRTLRFGRLAQSIPEIVHDDAKGVVNRRRAAGLEFDRSEQILARRGVDVKVARRLNDALGKKENVEALDRSKIGAKSFEELARRILNDVVERGRRLRGVDDEANSQITLSHSCSFQLLVATTRPNDTFV